MDNQQIITEDVNETSDAKDDMVRAGIFFLLLLIFQIPLSILLGKVHELFPNVSVYLLSILMTQGYLLFGALIFLLCVGKKFTRDLHLQKYKISSFFLSLLVLITASPMATFLNLVSQLFSKNEISTAILDISENIPVWLGIVVIGFLPGFIEETIYRGIVYQAFRKRSIMTGIVISALSFGLMHMNFNQIMYAIYLGVVFALLVEATGSLASSMVLHMIFNGFNTLYLYVLPKLLEFLSKFSQEYADTYLDAGGNVDIESIMSQGASKQQILVSMCAWGPMAIGGLVLTILLLCAIAKMNGRDIRLQTLLKKNTTEKDVKPVTICLIIGWVYCLVMAVIALFQ